MISLLEKYKKITQCCSYCEVKLSTENYSTESLNISCNDCYENCPHDEIECGTCQDCGQHISDFMDEDYGLDR